MRRFSVATLLIFFSLVVLLSVNTKSPICDEAGHHIAAGYSYVKTGDFRMNPSCPPLLRILMGLPLLFLNPKLPLEHPSWNSIESTVFSYQFLYVYNQNADKIVFLSRLPMMIISVFLGFLIFLWAKKLYGSKAGLFSLFLYVFSPTILANSGLAMLDIGCAFFMFLAAYQYWKFLHSKTPSFIALLLSGLCFGLAQATKINAVLLYPLFFVFALIYASTKEERFTNLKRLFLIFIIGIVTLWLTYGFEFKPIFKNAPDVQEKINYIRKFSTFLPFVNREKIADTLVSFAQDAPIPLSTYIVTFLGITNQVVIGQQSVFFLGKDYTQGIKIYYLIDFLIKEPLPFILLIFFSLGTLFQKKRTPVERATHLFLFLPIFAIFISTSLSKLQGGVRYLLPMYPFLFVWLADTINVVFKERLSRALKMVFASISVWYALVSLLTYPNYLAYANELVGGINGFGYKLTHDFDWGQDLSSLAKYLKGQGIEKVKLSYFGTADPAYYGITHQRLEPDEYQKPRSLVYAISLRYLRATPWALVTKPSAKIGYTIFVYDFR